MCGVVGLRWWAGASRWCELLTASGAVQRSSRLSLVCVCASSPVVSCSHSCLCLPAQLSRLFVTRSVVLRCCSLLLCYAKCGKRIENFLSPGAAVLWLWWPAGTQRWCHACRCAWVVVCRCGCGFGAMHVPQWLGPALRCLREWAQLCSARNGFGVGGATQGFVFSGSCSSTLEGQHACC